MALDESDLLEVFHSGSGPGGQHANKAATNVTLTHIPTGVSVRIQGRSQWQNRQTARTEIARRLTEHHIADVRAEHRAQKTDHDEERSFSWTQWRDTVKNHSNGKSTSMKRALKGRLGGLLS